MNAVNRVVWMGVFGMLVGWAQESRAYWHRLLTDSFDGTTSNQWTYGGVSNAAGQQLFRLDSSAQNVHAEWNQANVFGYGDPYVIVPSCLSQPLGRLLTDERTFRFGATLNITTGSVIDTSELFQIGSIAVCDVSQMGPDRPMSDNWSGNSQTLRDGSDFVEFSYFINNAWGGPNITANIGAHINGVDGEYTTGTNYLQTAMGEGHWLPEGTNLYVQVEYFGAATDELARTAHCAIYTEPERTNILAVNGVPMSYWTGPLPSNKFFRAAHLAFYNYPSANWGGANGFARGTLDDVYVDQFFDEGGIVSESLHDGQMLVSWASESGHVYHIESTGNLTANTWVTNAMIEANGEICTLTNSMAQEGRIYRVCR